MYKPEPSFDITLQGFPFNGITLVPPVSSALLRPAASYLSTSSAAAFLYVVALASSIVS